MYKNILSGICLILISSCSTLAFWSDDTDEENIEPVIPSYYLFDIKFSSNMTKHKWSFGVNNIFNTSYYDFAISSSSHGCFVTPWPSGPEACTYGRQSVYPLQRRNLTLDYSYKF